MGDGSLSQDEIDALLAGTEELMDSSDGGSPGQSAGGGNQSALSDPERTKLLDLFRAAADASASGLGTIVSAQVGVGLMNVDALGIDQIKAELQGKLVQVPMDFKGDIAGENVFVIPQEGAALIASMTMGQEAEAELSDMALTALNQTFSQIFGTGASSFSAKLGKAVQFAEPNAQVIDSGAQLTLPSGAESVRFSYSFKIDGKDVAIYQIVSLRFAKELFNYLMGVGSDMSFSTVQQPIQGGFNGSIAPEQVAPGMAGGIGISQVQYPQLAGAGTSMEDPSNISMLMDVQMQLSVELGRTRKSISEILGFGEGSIIELDKLAGEPVDVLVNGKLIAKGEVVVIDENFGVRVTEIVSTSARLNL